MDYIQNVHIGSIIKKVLAEKSMSISEFAGEINRDRTTIYDIFERKSIDTDLLIKISDVLNYDFIREVYLPKNTATTSSKIWIAVEVEKHEIKKLDLPKEFVRLVKHE
jgi:plasmid maintenance system antidote protein VapI